MARSKRALLLAAALSATSVVACAGILGLDEFSKGECAGAKCGDGGDLDVVTPDGGDSGSDASPDGPPGTEAVSWARWPMPNYATDAGTILPHQLDYNTDAGATADDVTDNVTHLTWRRHVLPNDFDVEGARGACAGLPDGPWRLPKRIELVTLLDYGLSSSPFIEPKAFPSFPPVQVWSSSEVRELDLPANPKANKPITKYWTVDFKTGKVDPADLGTPLRVLCVKAK